MSVGYLRRVYGVPVKRGMRVESIPDTPQYPTRSGVVTYATCYVWVRHDGEKRSFPYHPTSLRYFDKEGVSIWPVEEG